METQGSEPVGTLPHVHSRLFVKLPFSSRSGSLNDGFRLAWIGGSGDSYDGVQTAAGILASLVSDDR
jgi:hypothetical protein